MFTLETRVGRLIEARVLRLADPGADVYAERLRLETTKHAPARAFLAEHRGAGRCSTAE
jgi:hypothetical protein